jgi:hypothetical protein
MKTRTGNQSPVSPEVDLSAVDGGEDEGRRFTADAECVAHWGTSWTCPDGSGC